ncbi:MAG TPA: hypothetical protein DDW50_20905 [Firmicutes bacterium]|jgi:hypothetical protein|nr:hypothetical protein [Bacillota bacterium]
MKKILLLLTNLIVFLTCLVVMPVSAMEKSGIHGFTSFRYELADDFPGQVWTMDLHYRFIDWLAIGATEKTFTNGYNTYFSSVPAFYPNGQLYEVYLQFNIGDNVSVKLSQWCNHPVYSGTLNRTSVPSGVYIEGKYEF